MQLAVIPWTAPTPPDEAGLRRALEAEGFSVWSWSDAPGAQYAAHEHSHDETIWLVRGTIAFGVGGVEYRLQPGDRLMLPGATVHTAAAGPDGATYLVGER